VEWIRCVVRDVVALVEVDTEEVCRDRDRREIVGAERCEVARSRARVRGERRLLLLNRYHAAVKAGALAGLDQPSAVRPQDDHNRAAGAILCGPHRLCRGGVAAVGGRFPPAGAIRTVL
jgi:hypothetical protein